jgi:hypothetical protein
LWQILIDLKKVDVVQAAEAVVPGVRAQVKAAARAVLLKVETKKNSLKK